MARLQFDRLLDFVEHEGSEAFLCELRRAGIEPAPVRLYEGLCSPEEALTLAVALRGFGWEGQAREVLEVLVGASMAAPGAARRVTFGAGAMAEA